MNRILLLGGTGDALTIARDLDSDAVYSLAGLGRTPDDLRCEVRVGGFGGAEGLARYIGDAGITLVLDATHPYAARISANARAASDATGVPYWALSRSGWTLQTGDAWQMVAAWDDIARATADDRRVLFTVGRAPLSYLQAIPPHQHWFIRCLGIGVEIGVGPATMRETRATLLAARGPFSLDDERRLFDTLQCDVLVTKNSGGGATSAKLQVARERGMKVVMLARPALPLADRTFGNPIEIMRALRECSAPDVFIRK